ncbi:MAG: polysaccharide deacetylase family protein [Candidatus Gottesmanbacteria bacterium]|nr:polysaccharide deacetylase family protein [Candidatus Gottesmanbacteria bacterium]
MPGGGVELEQRIPATQIPVIEYHYIGYKGAEGEEPKDLVISQLDFLKEGNFRTLTDLEISSFLDTSAAFPAKSFALRIVQGSAHFAEFESTIDELKKRGFHAMVFVITGENYGQKNWDKLISWVKEGVISLSANSMTNPDFRKISQEQAINEAQSSKAYIEAKLASAGLDKKVVGFAFPGNSVPDNIDFLKTAGYKFAFGGNIYGAKDNAAKHGQFLLGTLCPDVLTSTLEAIHANPRNNPRSIPLNTGYTFDQLISLNMTPITIQTVENVVNTNYPELSFGKILYLPTDPEQGTHLTKPEGIIIHTTDQSGTNWRNWITDSVYESLLTRKIDVNFAVGLNGIDQYLRMYKDVATPTRGATGFGNYISIEMCGRDYNDILNPAADAEKKKSIETITTTTIQLVKSLMQNYQIDSGNVLGHFEASASGKTDPGENYMNNYFRPLLHTQLQPKPTTLEHWTSHKK